jgi:putative peptidoglycan lipid II flippase
MAFGIGLPAFILVKVLAPGFYARQDTRTPVRIGIYAMVANMVLNLSLVVPMVLAGWEGPHAGLALATSLSAWLNAGLLFRHLRRDGVYHAQPGWGRLLGQVSTAAVAMGLLLWWGLGDMGQWLAMNTTQRAGQLLLWVPAGAAVYFAVLLALGVRPRQLLGRA